MNESINPYAAPVTGEEPRPSPIDRDPQALAVTRKGLFAIYYGICAALFALGAGSLLSIFGVSMEMAFAAGLGIVVAIAAGLGGYLAIIIGQFACITVPEESDAKRYAQIAAVIQILSIALAFGNGVVSTVLRESGWDPIVIQSLVNFANMAMVLGGYVCFLYFLKNLSLYIGREDLAASSSSVARMVIVVSVMSLAFPLILGFVVGAVGAIGTFAFAGVILIAFLVFLATFIRYANLVGYVAKAIPT